jgi:hypothetical protein
LLQLVERSCLRGAQELQCLLRVAAVVHRPGGRERTIGAAARFGCQDGTAFEERSGRGEAAARPGLICAALQLVGDLVVGAEHGVRVMPGAALGIDRRIRAVGERTMDRQTVRERRCVVDDRADER